MLIEFGDSWYFTKTLLGVGQITNNNLFQG